MPNLVGLKYTGLFLLLALWSLIAAAGGNATGVEHGAGHTMRAASGETGLPESVGQVIDIRATDDMRFSHQELQLRQGETIRFRVSNDGEMMHEFVIGTVTEIDSHQTMMAGGHGGHHDADNALTLAPGQQEDLIWKFNQAGEFLAACNLPGHYEAGMRMKIRVVN